MSQPLRTCHHLHDDGGHCNSAAAVGQRYCAYHLDYRARRLRMAQYRARAQRYIIQLPPLENLYAVQSALSEIGLALAADMIELKRAQALLSVLGQASLNLRHPEKWQNNLYHSDQPAQVDVATQYGLPLNLDLDTPPEEAFPPARDPVIPPSGDAPLAAGNSADHRQPATDNPIHVSPEHPISPEFLELRDIRNNQGDEAEAFRFQQLGRNRARRELRTNRKRYADLAWRLNTKWAAEQLAERKLAEKLKQAGIAPAEAEPQDFDTRIAEQMKKAAASTAEIDACLAGKEVKIA